jgi:hypothetical protein
VLLEERRHRARGLETGRTPRARTDLAADACSARRRENFAGAPSARSAPAECGEKSQTAASACCQTRTRGGESSGESGEGSRRATALVACGPRRVVSRWRPSPWR